MLTMNQETLTKKKEQLIERIADHKRNNKMSAADDEMLNCLGDILNQIYLTNIKESQGRLSYFIRDSFDVKNFSVDEFFYFDDSLKLHNNK